MAMPIEIAKLLKLGKQAPRHDKRTLKLSDYLDYSKLPAPPQAVDWAPDNVHWGLMCNDNLGCCAISAPGHAVQTWTGDAMQDITTIPDAQIQAAYEAVGGYRPGHPDTDNGCNMLDVLNYWRKTGIGRHKITGFVAINPRDLREVQVAGWLFGGTYCGIALPNTAQRQVGGLWCVPGQHSSGDAAPGSWGGHAVYTPAFMPPSPLTPGQICYRCVTWGALQDYTAWFRQCYFDEEYAVLSPDWIAKSGQAPSGFDAQQLLADIAVLAAA